MFGSIAKLLDSSFETFKSILERLLSNPGGEADVLQFADCLFLRGSVQHDLPAFLLGRPPEDVLADVAARRSQVRVDADFWRGIRERMKAISDALPFLVPLPTARYPPFWVFCRFCSFRICSVYDIFALVDTKTTREGEKIDLRPLSLALISLPRRHRVDGSGSPVFVLRDSSHECTEDFGGCREAVLQKMLDEHGIGVLFLCRRQSSGIHRRFLQGDEGRIQGECHGCHFR